MSAFILDDINYDYLLTALGEHDCNKLGQILKDQNYRSVNHRYNEKKKPSGYKFCRVNHINLVQVLMLCDCYDYQSCETGDYHSTNAYKLIDRIRRHAIRKLPGYDNSKWGLSEEDRNPTKKEDPRINDEVKELINKALHSFSGTVH